MMMETYDAVSHLVARTSGVVEKNGGNTTAANRLPRKCEERQRDEERHAKC